MVNRSIKQSVRSECGRRLRVVPERRVGYRGTGVVGSVAILADRVLTPRECTEIMLGTDDGPLSVCR